MAKVNMQELVETAREFAGSMAEEVERITANAQTADGHGQISDTDAIVELRALIRTLATSQAAIGRIIAGTVGPVESMVWLVYMPGNGYFAGGMSWTKQQAKALRFASFRHAQAKAQDWHTTTVVKLGDKPADGRNDEAPAALREVLRMPRGR